MFIEWHKVYIVQDKNSSPGIKLRQTRESVAVNIAWGSDKKSSRYAATWTVGERGEIRGKQTVFVCNAVVYSCMQVCF